MVTRRRELSRLAAALRAGEYVAVSAGLQSGLTTFLDQCRAYLGAAPGLMGRDLVLIRNPRWHRSPMAHVAAEIALRRRGPVKDASARLRRLVRIEEEKGTAAMFESVLGLNDPGVVVLIDDVHRLELPMQRRLFSDARRLRELGSRSPTLSGVLMVVAGVIEWDRLDPERASPFANAATRIALPDLTLDEVIIFLARAAGEESARTQRVAKHIYTQSDGHPYLVARLAEAVGPARNPHFGLKAVDEAVASVITDGDDHLRQVREWLIGLSVEGRRPLSHVLQGRLVRRSRFSKDHDLERLLAHGVVRTDKDGRVTLRNAMYARFVRSDAMLRRQAWVGEPIAPANLVSERLGPGAMDAFLLVSRLENRLRNFVAIRLYTEYGDRWIDEGLEPIETTAERAHGNHARTLGAVLQLRRQKDQGEFMGPALEEPLLAYALLKELEAVVVKNWPIFKDLVPPQDRFKVYITQLNRVRNRLAHCRRLFPEDLDRLREIELSFRQWLPDG